MLSYIFRRFLLALFTIWAISVLSFVIIQLPPIDFIDTYITERIGAGGVQVTPEQIQALRGAIWGGPAQANSVFALGGADPAR